MPPPRRRKVPRLNTASGRNAGGRGRTWQRGRTPTDDYAFPRRHASVGGNGILRLKTGAKDAILYISPPTPQIRQKSRRIPSHRTIALLQRRPAVRTHLAARRRQREPVADVVAVVWIQAKEGKPG